jgi:polysaccharide biosynthesis/export protein
MRRRNGCLPAAAALLLALLASPASATDGYRIAPGDTIEVSVAGVAALQRTETVQADGTIALFCAGSVQVAGLAPAELQARAAKLLSARVLHYRLPDGREQVLLAKADEIVATVAKYRPIYVTGAVATPGRQEFRPSMTVLQAVAGAGGYGSAHRGDPVTLRRDYRSTSLEYLKEYFRVARLEAELKGKSKLAADVPAEPDVPAATAAALAHSEDVLLQTDVADYGSERGFLDEAVKQSQAQIDVLKNQEGVEKTAVEEDTKELARIKNLFDAGTVTVTRLTDARRALMLSSMQQLQTTVERMRLQRVRNDYRRQIAALTDKRQIELLTELTAARPHLAELHVSLRATARELLPFGGVAGGGPTITVMRTDAAGRRRFAASDDTTLEPGDVVDVALATDDANSAAATATATTVAAAKK